MDLVYEEYEDYESMRTEDYKSMRIVPEYRTFQNDYVAEANPRRLDFEIGR